MTASQSKQLKFRRKFKSFSSLDYHDVIVSRDDLELLTGPFWINDVIISFVFEYYRQEIYAQHDSLAFLPPDFIQLIKLTDETDSLSFINSLDLFDKEIIFLPINDHDQDTEGGTHWSLLVYFQSDNKFLHYDSQDNSCNFDQARIVAERLAPVLVVPKQKDVSTRVGRRSSQNHQIIGSFEDFPKQENSYDCGLYVIMAVTIISENFRNPNCGINVPDITQKSIDVLRDQIYKTIEIKINAKNQVKDGDFTFKLYKKFSKDGNFFLNF